jgi:PAS domain S-box-containing protein
MLDHSLPLYEIDARWQIVRANDAFCRLLLCTESSLIGRDARELLRQDWRHDFRNYVARALVGVGDVEMTMPFVAPCGRESWFKHELEPLIEEGRLAGYRASIQPLAAAKSETPKHWWNRRPAATSRVWDMAPIHSPTQADRRAS